MKTFDRKERAMFAKHASPEAIDAEIIKAEQAFRDIGRHLSWLQGLQKQREREVAEGQWPPPAVS